MTIQLVSSPWDEIFYKFAHSIESRAILVAPFIGSEPLDKLSDILASKSAPPKIDILTNLSVDSILQGSIDVSAVASFCHKSSISAVTHLPGLHAKAYIADQSLAIITSGNLTASSLKRNYEYGVQISDNKLVNEIVRDMEGYGGLGATVSLPQLDQFAETCIKLRAKHDATLRSARAEIRREFELEIQSAQEALMRLRASPGESTHAIFARTILYLLKDGPLSTSQINSLIEGTHPDLCDNTIDRVINGVHFGKKWKHMVRTAQVFLRRKGQIELMDGRWRLVK